MTENIATTIAGGAAAGVVATAAMSVPMLLAGEMGAMGEQPPKRIVRTVLGLAGEADASEGTQDLAASLAHLAFGAGGGATFAVASRALRLPVPPVVQGMVYGLGVWATSYKGWIPALGALPDADRDRPDRQRTMIVAHVVYGAVLGGLEGWRRRQWADDEDDEDRDG